MSATLTIRLSESERRRLQRKARKEKKSESELVRELIANMDESPGFEREDISHLAGCIKLLKKDNDPWRKKLREHNWRS